MEWPDHILLLTNIKGEKMSDLLVILAIASVSAMALYFIKFCDSIVANENQEIGEFAVGGADER